MSAAVAGWLPTFVPSAWWNSKQGRREGDQQRAALARCTSGPVPPLACMRKRPQVSVHIQATSRTVAPLLHIYPAEAHPDEGTVVQMGLEDREATLPARGVGRSYRSIPTTNLRHSRTRDLSLPCVCHGRVWPLVDRGTRAY